MLDHCCENPKPLKDPDIPELVKVKEEFEALEVEEAMEICPLLKVQKAFAKKGQEKMVKLKLTLYQPAKIIGLINTWLCHHQQGGKKMTGSPAPSSTERDLVKLLKKLDELK